ncbi:hemin uptake protein HemP [Kiloniella sp. GXU_MW_B19]|uniref:hemin uptake protein HemP n=1 Tax=Kiloniella sp. GXU_MW_B19 TaxID=3141326 RepID=UPI003F9FDC35
MDKTLCDNRDRSLLLANNCLQSADIFKDSKEIRIEHQGAFYTLRLTANGKLILTK